MAILKLFRVSMHPFNWWAIVKRAIDSYKPEKQGMDLRRQLAEIIRVFNSRLEPDNSVVENPYGIFVTKELEERRKRNAEIEAECEKSGEDPRQVEPVIEGTGLAARVVKRGYQALPNPLLREMIDFNRDQVRLIKAAVEKYAEGETSHQIDQGFVDAMDALESAGEVEVDTDKTGRPVEGKPAP
jgi:hypothetical protein